MKMHLLLAVMPDRPISPDELSSRMRQQAMAWLAQREHSRHELQQKLEQRFFKTPSRNAELAEAPASHRPEALLDEVLDWLEQQNYLSDLRCTGMLVRHHVERGHGPLRIRQELVQLKGVAPDLVETALAESQCDWVESAARLLQARVKIPPGDMKEKAKLLRFLQGRGFTPDQCRRALGKLGGQPV